MSAVSSVTGGVVQRMGAIPALAGGAVVGFLAVSHLRLSVALASLPALAWLVFYPGWTTVLAASSLPLLHDVSNQGGLNIGLSDLFTVLALIGLIVQVVLDRERRQKLAFARPLLVCAAPFVGWLIVLGFVHSSSHVLESTVQDIELTVVPMVIGAVALNRRTAHWATTGFLLLSVVLALTWLAGGHSAISGDKNAAGQFIADAILVALVIARRWWLRLALLAVLVGGLFSTQSRGSVVAVCVGLLILTGSGGLGTWRESLFGAVSLAMLVLLILILSPQSVQQRVTSIDHTNAGQSTAGLTPGSPTGLANLPSAQYSLRLRSIYRHDGLVLAEHNELVGVGTGNYLTGSAVAGTQTDDPHNMLILTAAEGGLPDLGFFVVLVICTAALVARRHRSSPWVVPALAVQAAIITHGFVDVYWVRGTPVMGWLLVGMAFNRDLDYGADTAPAL